MRELDTESRLLDAIVEGLVLSITAPTEADASKAVVLVSAMVESGGVSCAELASCQRRAQQILGFPVDDAGGLQ